MKAIPEENVFDFENQNIYMPYIVAEGPCDDSKDQKVQIKLNVTDKLQSNLNTTFSGFSQSSSSLIFLCSNHIKCGNQI